MLLCLGNAHPTIKKFCSDRVNQSTNQPTNSTYETFVSLLTDFQFKCLSALARESGKSVYSMDFVKAVGLHSTASVNRAITRMIDINILFKSGKEIRYVEPSFLQSMAASPRQVGLS